VIMRGFLGLFATSLLVSPVLAETTDAIASKVQALSHPRYAEREKAARELEAIGERALNALREAADSKDEELRARAAAVAERIERTSRNLRLLEAPKLALKFDKTPLDKAVTEFAAKAQRRVILDKAAVKNPDRTVTLDTGNIPYWEAVEAFYRAAGLIEDDEPFAAPPPGSGSGPGPRTTIRRSQGPGTTNSIRLIDGQPAGTVATDQAFRVRALKPSFAQNKYDEIKGEVTIHLDIDPAPGVAVREIVGIEVRKATTDDGRALTAAYPDPPTVGPFTVDAQMLVRQMTIAYDDVLVERIGANQAVTLKTGGLRPQKLAELQGVIVARVITPPEPVVTIPRLLRPGSREATADGMSVQVREVATGKDNRVIIQARVVTRNDPRDDVVNLPIQMKGRARQFIRIQRGVRSGPSDVADLKVVDAAGVPIRGLSAKVTAANFDGVNLIEDVTLSFEKPADGADALGLTLMGKRPAIVEMPFVLKDVPMP
jgi:hypothetical protein